MQKAPQLNDKIGKVERADPRPAQKGRWEIEVRLDGGLLELKSLKPENICAMKFNSELQHDKKMCKQWMRDEKAHAELRARRELLEEELYRRKVEEKKKQQENDAKRQEQEKLEKLERDLREAERAARWEEPNRQLKELGINEEAKKVLFQLDPKAALDILKRAGKATGVSNLNTFVENQAKLALGLSDSDSDGEGTKSKRARR